MNRLGDNLLRRGRKGAAALRDLPNTFGFVTKKAPSWEDSAYFRPADYEPVFRRELRRLRAEIEAHPEKTYLISRLGAGLANRFRIWETVIRPGLAVLRRYPNVVYLFDWEET